MRAEPYFSGISHSAGKELAGFTHTLASCLSMYRVWLQYVKRAADVLHYSSIVVPLVLLIDALLDFPLKGNTYAHQCLGMIGYKQMLKTLARERIPISNRIELMIFL